MDLVKMLNIFKVPPNVMRLVISAAAKFKALLINAKANKHNRMVKLRLQTEHDPYYENGRLLQLKGKLIKPVPYDLYTLTELTTLDMSASRESNLDCLLDKLPVELMFLKNLRCLHIDVNNISIIPVEIGELVNLEKLTITNNKISCLPSSFKKLQKLNSLHLANNLFEHFPIIVCSLVNLRFLDFSNNQLVTLPEKIGDLRKLEIFLLFHNLIEVLPDSLFTLIRLKTLWLGDNLIRRLPKNFANLKNLDWETTQLSSNIGGNPLVEPPIEICEKGVKAVASYYRAIEGRRRSSQRSFDFKQNSITNKTILPKIQQERRPSLRNFKFNNNSNFYQTSTSTKSITSTTTTKSNNFNQQLKNYNNKSSFSSDSTKYLPKLKTKL